MKDKWKAFFAALGIGKVESSADGIFMKEEDVDKMHAVHTANETLKAELQAEKDSRAADSTAKDATIATLTEEKTTLSAEISTLTSENTRLTTELSAATAGETVLTKPVADPAITATGKAKKSANEIAADRNAAALRGEAVSVTDEEAEEDEEATAPENKTK